jgi:hypothetical protein
MPLLSILLLAVNAFCIVHAARSGRFWPWAYVVLFLPGIGAVAYFFLELVPEWQGTPSGRRATAQIGRTIAPEKRYRQLKEDLETADTIANRKALAEECGTLGRHDEAIGLWESILPLPLGDDPKIHENLARALFVAGHSAEALKRLEILKDKWPDYHSGDGHLLYARCLAALGRSPEAEAELRNLLNYFTGPEPALELARLLDKTGRHAEAGTIAADYVRRLERSPRFTRQPHAEALRDLKQLAR